MARSFLARRTRKLKNTPFGVFKIKDANGKFTASAVVTSTGTSSASDMESLYERLTSPSRFIWYTGAKELAFLVQYLERANTSYVLIGKVDNGLTTGNIEIRNVKYLLNRDIDEELADRKLPIEMISKAIYASVVTAIRELKDIFGVEPAWSLGRTAIRVMQAMLPEDKTYSRLNPKAEIFIDNFRFGGSYSYQYKGEKIENAVTIDCKAAYAARMRGEFPVRKSVLTKKFIPGVLGFYECDICYPEDLFPMIPSKNEKNETVYLTGNFRGFVTSETMEFFTGYGVTFKVIKGQLFYDVERPFADLIDKFEEAEKNASPDFKRMVKGMRTSLSGTFGTKRNVEIRKAGYADIGQKQMVDKDNKVVPSHTEKTTMDEEWMMPHWYSLITSRQRIELARILFSIDKRDILRVATDSITVPRHVGDKLVSDVITLSDKYGDYKIEHVWSWITSWDTMEYEGMSEGKYIYKCNGVPQRAFRGDSEVSWTSVAKPVTVAQTGNLTITRSRVSLSNRYGI